MSKFINIGMNVETFLIVTVVTGGIIGILLFLRIDLKRYGLLYLLSVIVGNVLCYLFVELGFYSYPYRLFPTLSRMPIVEITLSFPLLVLLSVRYSPKIWAWKIPFYWAIIHIGMFIETVILMNTRIITYEYKWDFWDSYTWWWIYLLVFEWIGSMIIPEQLRKPLSIRTLRYGRLGWFLIHFVLIITIFLGGYYLGSLK
ncbi:CBO0543 family protein [Anaerobacillus sp. MEB173]|uniref:CBO0543 family protein n=1 Tax=Anaerobacillus sp. MEB173 TaxID=3383345 RepID=UPI003F920A1E